MMHDLWTSQPLDEMRELLRAQWQLRTSQNGGVPLPPNFRFEIYRDSIIGLNEIVRGLLEFFPHKPTIAIVRGTTPKVSSFITGLSKDGIICKEIPLSLAEENPSSALALCDADTLMVISGTADPLSARVFNLMPFQDLLTAKKIFSVELSPFLSAVSFSTAPSPYRAQLVSLSPQLAVGVLGSRAKGPPLIMGVPFFAREDFAQLSKLFLNIESLDQKWIQKFENSTRELGTPFLNPETARVWNRAVLHFDGVDGYAICELLCEQKGWKLSEALGRDFDTASGCRWAEWNFGSWLSEQGVSVETQKGLVVFDLKFVKANPNLSGDLVQVCKELCTLQNT